MWTLFRQVWEELIREVRMPDLMTGIVLQRRNIHIVSGCLYSKEISGSVLFDYLKFLLNLSPLKDEDYGERFY